MQIAFVGYSASCCALGIFLTHVFYRWFPDLIAFSSEKAAFLSYLVWCAVLAVVFAAGSIYALVLSNRCWGPLYRMRRHMKQVTEGLAISRFSFRDKDFFPELADSYNELLAYLDKLRNSENDRA
jgi:hypothetical protein